MRIKRQRLPPVLILLLAVLSADLSFPSTVVKANKANKYWSLTNDSLRAALQDYFERKQQAEDDFSIDFDPKEIEQYDTRFVTDMSQLFQGKTNFNADLGSWQVEKVTDLSYMFQGATDFEGIGLEKWNVTNVETTQFMFQGATAFQGDLATWRMPNIRSMEGMFQSATQFNQILCWDFLNTKLQEVDVIDVQNMFCDTRAAQLDPCCVESNWIQQQSCCYGNCWEVCFQHESSSSGQNNVSGEGGGEGDGDNEDVVLAAEGQDVLEPPERDVSGTSSPIPTPNPTRTRNPTPTETTIPTIDGTQNDSVQEAGERTDSPSTTTEQTSNENINPNPDPDLDGDNDNGDNTNDTTSSSNGENNNNDTTDRITNGGNGDNNGSSNKKRGRLIAILSVVAVVVALIIALAAKRWCYKPA